MEFIHGYFNLVCQRNSSDKAVSDAYAKNAGKWCAKKKYIGGHSCNSRQLQRPAEMQFVKASFL